MDATKICLALALSMAMAGAFGQWPQSDAYRFATEAYSAQAQGRYNDAEIAARAALAQEPDNVAMARMLVDALTRQGRDGEAMQVSSQLTVRFPQDREALAQQGFLAQRLGDCRLALTAFDAALGLHGWSDVEERHLKLAEADCALAIHQPQRVLDLLAGNGETGDAAVAQRRAAAAIDEAYALLRGGDDCGALKWFEAGFAQATGNAQAYADASYVAQRIGDNTRAAVLFRASLHANEQAPVDQRYGSEQARLPAGDRTGVAQRGCGTERAVSGRRFRPATDCRCAASRRGDLLAAAWHRLCRRPRFPDLRQTILDTL
jgi:Tfp pilus assembly protein PilF